MVAFALDRCCDAIGLSISKLQLFGRWMKKEVERWRGMESFGSSASTSGRGCFSRGAIDGSSQLVSSTRSLPGRTGLGISESKDMGLK